MNRNMRTIVAGLLAAAMTVGLTACGSSSSSSSAAASQPEQSTSASAAGTSGLEDGVLTVAMECAYAPYNWTQPDDSNGAVPIKGASDYANGYDVIMAKKIAEELGVELEIVRSDWDSLVPAVQSGTVDAVIAGQSMTPERSEQVDFAGPYFYATIVCLTKADSPYAQAQRLADLAGATGTAQIATIWYDTCLPQIEGAEIKTAAESAPAMLMALETGTVDFVCTDMPTAQGALQAYPDMVLLDFNDSDDNFVVDEGDINIGISMRKGNTELKKAIDGVLAGMTADDFNDLMAQAISVQPISGCLIGLCCGILNTIPYEQEDPLLKRFFLKLIRAVVRIYVEVFRGTPMILQAVFCYYGLPYLTDGAMQFNSVWAASILVVSINTGAYMAESVRGGIISVDPGQTEGAKAIGMNHFQTMTSVILPQALRNIMHYQHQRYLGHVHYFLHRVFRGSSRCDGSNVSVLSVGRH